MERQDLCSLLQSLPKNREGDLEQGARFVVSLLLESILTADFSSVRALEQDPRSCPNCGEGFSSPTSPYCSACCKERAGYVRQFRQALESGSLHDPEKQMHKGEVLWRLLGGGLPRRVAAIPERARARVFKDAEGKCEACGAPATTIDNMGSG